MDFNGGDDDQSTRTISDRPEILRHDASDWCSMSWRFRQAAMSETPGRMACGGGGRASAGAFLCDTEEEEEEEGEEKVSE